jgi:hypothetical protein
MEAPQASAANQLQNIRNKDQANENKQLHSAHKRQRKQDQYYSGFGRRDHCDEQHEQNDCEKQQERLYENGHKSEQHGENERHIEPALHLVFRRFRKIDDGKSQTVEQDPAQKFAFIYGVRKAFFGQKHNEAAHHENTAYDKLAQYELACVFRILLDELYNHQTKAV